MENEKNDAYEMLKRRYDSLQKQIHHLEESINRLLEVNNLNSEKDKYMDVINSCHFLGIGRNTIYALMREGKLGYTILGRQRRILISELKRYASSNYKKPKKSIL